MKFLSKIWNSIRASSSMSPLHDDDRQRGRYGNQKYGVVPSRSGMARISHQQARARCRKLYANSLVFQALVQRLTDMVVNTGLIWESQPVWSILGDRRSSEERYEWTRSAEQQFKFYTGSTDADVTGRMSFSQLQRLIYSLKKIEGEVFCIVRYVYPSRTNGRFSPVAIQILNPDQIQTPYERIGDKSIVDGIEIDQNGEPIACWVQDTASYEFKRIPYWSSARQGRQFVIHYANITAPGQYRGYPEFDATAYEIDGLAEYDVAELEAANASALFVGSIEATEGAVPGRGPKFSPAFGGAKAGNVAAGTTGFEEVRIGKKAILLNNMAPGYTMKGFVPTRPNPNYVNFRDAQERSIAGAYGVPHSVFKLKFDASYSASRGETQFAWVTVERERDDFVSGFLKPLHILWFMEQVQSGDISAPGYFASPTFAAAWQSGIWAGMPAPSIDPLKEASAAKERLAMNHTTGEREARLYNGSDYQENAERRKIERQWESQESSPVPVPDDEPEEDEEQEMTNLKLLRQR